MLTRHLNVTLSMVWTIVLANIITVGASLAFINHLARLTTIKGTLLIPILVLLTFVGSYTANNNLSDVLVMLFFGGIGYLMLRYRWPRAPLVLGLVLGEIAERYLWISVARYGASWLFRPLVMVLLFITVGVIVTTLVQQRREQVSAKPHEAAGAA